MDEKPKLVIKRGGVKLPLFNFDLFALFSKMLINSI